MKIRGALAGDDVDLTAPGAAQFGQVTAGLDLKLLHGIQRQTQVHRIEGRIRVGYAVQQEIVRVGTVAADGDGGGLAGPPVERAHVAGLRAMADVRVRNGQCQVEQHAAVQRQILDRLGLHDFAQADVLRS